jgi:hypothetical protein
MSNKSLKNFMKPSVRAALGDQPTTHRNCMDVTGGIARPGKTARDRANGKVIHKPYNK